MGVALRRMEGAVSDLQVAAGQREFLQSNTMVGPVRNFVCEA